MYWYKMFIRMNLSGVIIRYIKCFNKLDLWCCIGWLHSTSLEKIDRIDYKIVLSDDVENDKIIEWSEIYYESV